MAVPHSRLAFGADWGITCALPLKIKTKNKPAPFQIEKSHQHPETGWGGPKNPPVQLCWEAGEGGVAAPIQVPFPGSVGLMMRTGMAFGRWGNIPPEEIYPSVLVPNCILWNFCWFLPPQALSRALQLVTLGIARWECLTQTKDFLKWQFQVVLKKEF